MKEREKFSLNGNKIYYQLELQLQLKSNPFPAFHRRLVLCLSEELWFIQEFPFCIRLNNFSLRRMHLREQFIKLEVFTTKFA